MKKLLAILLSVCLISCTHQVYVAQDGIITEHGVIKVGQPRKVTPNDTTKYTILYQAAGFGKTKTW